MMFYKHEPLPDEIKNTQAGYVMSYIMNAAASMMNQRFSEITQKPDAPFTFAYAYDSDFFVSKTKDAWTVVGGSAEDKIGDALAAMKRETERMRQHGFTAAEYEVARTNILKSYEDSYNNRDKQRNSAYSQEYVRAFTDAEPIPGIEFEHQFIQTVAPNIPVEAINQTIQQANLAAHQRQKHLYRGYRPRKRRACISHRYRTIGGFRQREERKN